MGAGVLPNLQPESSQGRFLASLASIQPQKPLFVTRLAQKTHYKLSGCRIGKRLVGAEVQNGDSLPNLAVQPASMRVPAISWYHKSLLQRLWWYQPRHFCMVGTTTSCTTAIPGTRKWQKTQIRNNQFDAHGTTD